MKMIIKELTKGTTKAIIEIARNGKFICYCIRQDNYIYNGFKCDDMGVAYAWLAGVLAKWANVKDTTAKAIKEQRQ